MFRGLCCFKSEFAGRWLIQFANEPQVIQDETD